MKSLLARIPAGRERTARAVILSAALMVGATGLTGCGGAAGGSDGYVLHYTTYSNATSDQSRTAQRWAEDVEDLTDGGVTVKFHYAQSLVGAEESVQATQDGRADMGQIGSIYAASDLSMFTVIELPFETKNPEVQMRAIERLYEENETYRDDFDRQGVRLLFPLPLGIALVGLKEKADVVSDLKGRSIRAGGLTSEVMVAAGANPVAMTAVDIYESMERGVVDGYTALAIANLPTFGLSEATPYVVDPGIGAYSSSIVVINEDLFQSMPEKYQEALLEASEEGITYGLEEMDKLASESCKDLIASKAEFSALPPDQVAELKKQANVAEGWVARYEERDYDAQSVLEDYRQIIKEETGDSQYADPLVACMRNEAGR